MEFLRYVDLNFKALHVWFLKRSKELLIIPLKLEYVIGDRFVLIIDVCKSHLMFRKSKFKVACWVYNSALC